MPIKNTHPTDLSSVNERDETPVQKQKLKEVVSTRPVFQERLKGVYEAEQKGC